MAASSEWWGAPAEWFDPSEPVPELAVPADEEDDLLGSPSFDLDIDQCMYWADDGETWIGDASGDGEGVSAEEAESHAANMMLSKYHSGKWHATDICKLCYWLKCAGLKHAVAELSKKPGQHSSNYNKHMKHVIGLDGQGETLQHLSVPVSDNADGSRGRYDLHVIHPHEALNKEISESPELHDTLATHVRESKLPPIYTQHPVAIASEKKAQPIVIYIDGVPTTKRDGVIGVWTDFVLSPKRHLFAVV